MTRRCRRHQYWDGKKNGSVMKETAIITQNLVKRFNSLGNCSPRNWWLNFTSFTLLNHLWSLNLFFFDSFWLPSGGRPCGTRRCFYLLLSGWRNGSGSKSRWLSSINDSRAGTWIIWRSWSQAYGNENGSLNDIPKQINTGKEKKNQLSIMTKVDTGALSTRFSGHRA